jgi:putative tryptophan/tyrosine transport system substrate-binding protein
MTAPVGGGKAMNRRSFLAAMSGSLLAAPFAAEAQTVGRAPRIGLLMPGHLRFDAPATHGFRQGLRELGYVEGRTLAIEYRAAEGKPERYPELVADLLRVPVDLIVLFSVAALPALTRATKDVPVVLATLSDPVREGYAKSFARPDGNITGLTLVNDEFLAKRLQILKEAVSGTTRWRWCGTRARAQRMLTSTGRPEPSWT